MRVISLHPFSWWLNPFSFGFSGGDFPSFFSLTKNYVWSVSTLCHWPTYGWWGVDRHYNSGQSRLLLEFKKASAPCFLITFCKDDVYSGLFMPIFATMKEHIYQEVNSRKVKHMDT